MVVSYEQVRLKRVHDNQKKMAEFKLSNLAQSLHVSSSSKACTKAKPKTQRVTVESSEIRRSTRAKNKPNYREIELVSPGKRKRGSPRRDSENRVYVPEEARENATKRAKKLQSSLEPEFPSFVKQMHHSHVTEGFWLGLPVACRPYLSRDEERIILVDEKDEEFETRFIPRKHGLSAGWRGFAIRHKIADGDATVFQLIKPDTFKVYIIRLNEEANNDSDGNGNKENVTESNKKQEENVSEATQLRGSIKRKKRGRK